MVTLNFGTFPKTTIQDGLAPVPKARLDVVNSMAKKQKAKGLILMMTKSREIMWDYPDFIKDEQVLTIFHLLHKGNKLKLPKVRRSNEMRRTNDFNYCLFHKMVHHPTCKCFVLKNKIQALMDASVTPRFPKYRIRVVTMTNRYSWRVKSLPWVPQAVNNEQDSTHIYIYNQVHG